MPRRIPYVVEQWRMIRNLQLQVSAAKVHVSGSVKRHVTFRSRARVSGQSAILLLSCSSRGRASLAQPFVLIAWRYSDCALLTHTVDFS